MSILESIILAIIEGLTEFLPVSSTGHLVVAESLMGMAASPYVKAFTVIIQLGAILSVVVLYHKRFLGLQSISGEVSVAHGGKAFMSFYLKLFVGILPAVVLGLLFNDWVDEALGNVWVIIVNLILGGVFMIFTDRIRWRHRSSELSYKQALWIGLWQCIAIFLPGISRSMATIVGGLFVGLKRKTAAEFSFFLAVPTMFGATVLQTYKLYKAYGAEIFSANATTLWIGNILSFLVAMVAIKFFVSYISRRGFAAFGIYRILFAVSVAVLLLLGFSVHVG